MGFSDEVSTSKMPTPLGRSAENRAAIASTGSKAYLAAAAVKVAGGSALQLHATSSDKEQSAGQKRRLTPMELKQRQRQQKEQRKRPKLSLSAPSARAAAVLRNHRGNGGRSDEENEVARTQPMGRPAHTALSPGGAPLRRSASSPPNISCLQGSNSNSLTGRGCEQQATALLQPPPRRRSRLIDRRGDLSEGRLSLGEPDDNDDDIMNPDVSNQPKIDDVVKDDWVDRGASVETAGNEIGIGIDNVVDDDMANAGESGCGTRSASGFGNGRAPSREDTSAGDIGGGGGGGAASLFSMVMSGASSSSTSSCIRGARDGAAGGGGGGSDGLLKFSSSRAKGGTMKSVTSTLSGMLRRRTDKVVVSVAADGERADGMLPQQQPECEDTILMMDAPSVMGVREGGSGVITRGSGDDWMAMNLEKLSSFRVPETRMGFSESGVREGLRRSATAPAGGGRGSSARRITGGDRPQSEAVPSNSARTSSRYPGDCHWQLDSPFPLGSSTIARTNPTTTTPPPCTTTTTPTADSSGTAPGLKTGDGSISSLCQHTPAIDLSLRTIVRFEMAPGIPIPPGISGVPGHLEFRALKAFAAGDTGFVDDIKSRQQKAERISDSAESLAGTGGGSTGPPAIGAERGGVGVGGSVGGGVGEAKARRAAEANIASESAQDAARVREVEAAAEAAATEEREQAIEQWRKATLYWAHPATPLPQEALAAQKAAHARVVKNPAEATKARGTVHPGGSAATGWTSFFLSRRRDWEQAFASLYYILLARRREHNDRVAGSNLHRYRGHRNAGDRDGWGREGFYLQCPRYTVLWRLVPENAGAATGDGAPGRVIPAAVMTQSNRRLRKRLTDAGIEFEMPLDPAGDQRDAKADADVLEEWKALGATGNAKAGSAYANEEDRSRPHLSLLVFKGHMAVHGLFDFLLESCSSSAVMGGSASGGVSKRRGGGASAEGGGGGDVPLLLSREPFLNASLRALKVRQNGPMHRSRANGNSTDTSDVQVLELVGHVLPSALTDLCLAMSRACAAFSPSRPPDLGRGQEIAEAEHEDILSGNAEELPEGGGVADGKCGGKNLFRAVLSVDPGTAHLNAAFRALEASMAAAVTATRGGIGYDSEQVTLVRGSYCSETRARVFSRTAERDGGGGGIMFDVCSTEPSVAALL